MQTSSTYHTTSTIQREGVVLAEINVVLAYTAEVDNDEVAVTPDSITIEDEFGGDAHIRPEDKLFAVLVEGIGKRDLQETAESLFTWKPCRETGFAICTGVV